MVATLSPQRAAPQPIVDRLKDEITLFDRLGGRARLERVHRLFYDKVFNHPVLGAFFVNNEQRHQEDQQSDFMMRLFGGPSVYGGRPPRGAHQHLFITEEHFDMRHELLAETLGESGVIGELKDAWLAYDLSFKRAIVKQSIDQCEKRYTNDEILTAPGS